MKFWEKTEKADLKRLSKQKPTEGVAQINDIPYIDDGDPMHLLDIYYPENTKTPLPVIIDIHGGGWMYGTKDLNKNYCLYLASKGFCVINPSYRLCPDTTVLGQIDDIFNLFHWVDKHGKDYPCDLDNIFITGDSAGAHLAGLSCAIMGRDDLPEIFKVTLPKFRFNAVGFTCGGFDPVKVMNLPIPIAKAYKKIFLGKDYESYPYTSYLNLSALVGGTKFPPIYMVSSKEDFVLSQSVEFSKKLGEYEVTHYFRKWGRGKGKTLSHVFNILYPEWEESIITNDEMLSLFRDNIKKK